MATIDRDVGMESITITIGGDVDVDEVVLAFRREGQLKEVASMDPPVEGVLRRISDDE